MVRTMPFILLRTAACFGITLGYILVTGVGYGIGYGVGGFGEDEFRASATMWGGFAGFGTFGAVMYWAREYILYIVKAGHIAVLIVLIDGKPMPQGRSQIDHATAAVKERFPQASVLFAVDQLIKGVVRAISGLVCGILTVLPIPGAQQLGGIISAFFRVAVGFVERGAGAFCPELQTDVEECRMAGDHRLRPKLCGVHPHARTGGAGGLPDARRMGGRRRGLCAVVRVERQAALLEPFAITCMMQIYFKTIEGQQPNPEWEAKLEQMSGKFRKLKDRAFGAGNDADEIRA